MSPYSPSVLLLLCGLLMLTVAMAVLNTLVPLWLTHDKLATWQIGIVSSAYFLGNLCGTLLAGALIARCGFNRSYQYACILLALASAALGMATDFGSWLGWRFLAGVACALVWVAVESALLHNGSNANRGRLLAAYMMVYYLGTVVGQLLLGVVPTALLQILPWITALMVIAILPLLLVRFSCSVTQENHVSIRAMLIRRDARMGIKGCVISGVVLGALYGVLPLYFSHQGMSDARVGYWMALLVSAGIIGQWPVGRLTELWGRRLVLRVQLLLIMVGSAMMLGNYAMMPALFILGCAGFTLYPVAMSWACEKIAGSELVAMNQTLLLSYTVGSLIGPAITVMLMQRYSDSALFLVIAIIALIYWLMLFRNTDHHYPLPA